MQKQSKNWPGVQYPLNSLVEEKSAMTSSFKQSYHRNLGVKLKLKNNLSAIAPYPKAP